MKKNFFSSDIFILILLASAKFILHLLTNHNYGFHRDELATLHAARTLAGGQSLGFNSLTLANSIMFPIKGGNFETTSENGRD